MQRTDDMLSAYVFMSFLTFSSDDSSQPVRPNIAVKEVFFKYWFRRAGKW